MIKLIGGLVLAASLGHGEAGRVAAPASRSALVQYAEPALREHLSERFDSVAIEPAGRTAQPACAGARFVSREMTPSPLAPRMLVSVRAECPDGSVETLPVWFAVRASADVAVAARDIPAGARVTRSDVRIAKAEVQAVEQQLLPAGASAVGMQALVPVRAGTPLTRASVRAEPAVIAQQPVVIRAGSGKVRIEALGLALQNGGIGDRVQVLNLSSGETLSARVTQAQAVEVLR